MNAMLDRLDASAQRQRDFVADVSHDLQSPLAAQRVALELALRSPTASTRPAARRGARARPTRWSAWSRTCWSWPRSTRTTPARPPCSTSTSWCWRRRPGRGPARGARSTPSGSRLRRRTRTPTTSAGSCATSSTTLSPTPASRPLLAAEVDDPWARPRRLRRTGPRRFRSTTRERVRRVPPGRGGGAPPARLGSRPRLPIARGGSAQRPATRADLDLVDGTQRCPYFRPRLLKSVPARSPSRSCRWVRERGTHGYLIGRTDPGGWRRQWRGF